MVKFTMEATAHDPRLKRLDELEQEVFSRAEAEALGVTLPDDGWAPIPNKLMPVDLAAVMPGPVWLIPDLLERESLTVLGGPPGQGKSWLAMSLAVSLTRGDDVLGFPTHHRHRCLYLDYENGEREVRRRFTALGWSTDSPGQRLRVYTDRPKITGEEELAALLGEVAAFAPDLVVIDTFPSAAVLDENSARDVEDFFARVWRPLRQRGVALMVLHHTRKGQPGGGRDRAIDRFRGSGHLVGRVDNAWLLDGASDGAHRLCFVKTRHGVSPADVILGIQDQPNDAVRVETRPPAEPRADQRRAEILEHLSYGRLKASGLAAVLDVSVNTTNRYLRSMVADGVIEKVGEHYGVK